MKMQAIAAMALAGVAAIMAVPAEARVEEANARGIVLRYVAHVPVSPDEAWALLVRPAQWWDASHTYSGDAANLSLDARPGGCFCEILPSADAGGAPRGGVEHMRAIYVDKGRALRLRGALGPLQADAAVATLTFQFRPDDSGTQILAEYVVGGFFRGDPAKLAPMFDGVIGGQIDRLVGALGGSFAAAFGAQAPGADAAPADGKTRIIGR